MSKVKIRGDRNVPWIGDLAFRDVIPLKYVSKINTATLPENTSPETILDYIDISAVDSDGHIGDIQELTFETAPSRARRVVRKGDTIVSTVRTYLKAIAHIDWDNPRLVCSTGFAVVSPSEGMDPKYMYYWLRSTPIVDEISARSVGVSYPAIGPSEVGSLPVPRIPERLQRDIVAFLDGRIRAIDKILGRYQLLIERLHEYRQALITQAVTKGLDPNVPMKDSGIPWLGQIPEHWSVKKIAWRFRRIGSGTTPTSANGDYYDGDIPWVNTGELRDAIVTDTAKKITRRAMMDHSALKLYPKGSLVLALYGGATIGKLGILGIDATVNQACCVMTDPVETDVRFAFYWFLGIRQHLLSMGLGGGQANISQEIVRQLRMPAPRVDEQQSIVQYLDAEVGKIDRLVGAYQEEIDHLNEYRQALITAAVTGKIDVRQEVQEHAC